MTKKKTKQIKLIYCWSGSPHFRIGDLYCDSTVGKMTRKHHFFYCFCYVNPFFRLSYLRIFSGLLKFPTHLARLRFFSSRH